MSKYPVGYCQGCGVHPIDWDRIHRRDISDVVYTLSALHQEYIRSHYMTRALDEKAFKHAMRKGRARLREALYSRLNRCIRTKTEWDGRQTPWEGNIIFYAQHALGCCCRKCLEYWHGLPIETELTDSDIQYFVDLGMIYIGKRLPTLPECESKWVSKELRWREISQGTEANKE